MMRLTPADLEAWDMNETASRRAAAVYRNARGNLTDEAAREAHRLYKRGERTPEVIDGERRYQRERSRMRVRSS